MENRLDTSFYVAALERLEEQISDLQRSILIAHYFAPSRRATAPQLATLAGVAGGYPTVNAQYGRLGHMFCDSTGFAPDLRPDGTPKWWSVWSIGFDDPAGFIWQMHDNVARALESLRWVDRAAIPLLPEEVGEVDHLIEGARIQINVNGFERNRDARQKCIDYHGSRCSVCKFDFGARFGDIGIGFIHVHHLSPLSSIGDDYVVDPISDLRPVCPNCHAMIHRRSPPFSIDEIKFLLNQAESRQPGT